MNGIPRIPEPREWLLTKVCSKCGERKPWAHFSPNAWNEDGSVRYVTSRCKACRAAESGPLSARRRERDPEGVRTYGREWLRQRVAHHRREAAGQDRSLPAVPLAEFLAERLEIHGTMRELAALCGCDEAGIRRVLKGAQQRVSLGKADQYITRLGFHLSDVYPADSLAASSEAPGHEPESSTSVSPVGLLPRKGQR